MENKMFCYQCQETAGGKGCTVSGVCGKKPEVSAVQDLLIYVTKGLSSVTSKLREEGGNVCKDVNHLITLNLFTTITNASFDRDAIIRRIKTTLDIKLKLLSEIKDVNSLPEAALWNGDESCFNEKAASVGIMSCKNEDIRSLRELITYGLKGLAAYSKHANALLQNKEDVDAFIQSALAKTLDDSLSAEDLIALTLETGKYGVDGMALLDKANTTTFGKPFPNQVTTHVEKGPFIIITGHDLYDLKMLLEQTEGKGVNVYTHGEMLPAHGYPELRKYAHLKGNFGTAWNNQRKEFDGVPAPILYTTNCIMPPKESYREGIYTTSVVAYPNTHHISADENGHKDFTDLINTAIELGGYTEDKVFGGTNGGEVMPTGFGHGAVLEHAGEVIEAVKNGQISHFFLVGGCDGAKPGRSYYTDLVRQAPKDSVILTLACGKFRFNDLDLGTVAGLPRLMDMGQCNDAYGAVQVALALAGAFECGVNDLPLTLVLSWYEQKAVCVLLTLLSLGIKNIYVGPSLPAFFSDAVLSTLVELFDLHPITTAEEDLKTILA